MEICCEKTGAGPFVYAQVGYPCSHEEPIQHFCTFFFNAGGTWVVWHAKDVLSRETRIEAGATQRRALAATSALYE